MNTCGAQFFAARLENMPARKVGITSIQRETDFDTLSGICVARQRRRVESGGSGSIKAVSHWSVALDQKLRKDWVVKRPELHFNSLEHVKQLRASRSSGNLSGPVRSTGSSIVARTAGGSSTYVEVLKSVHANMSAGGAGALSRRGVLRLRPSALEASLGVPRVGSPQSRPVSVFESVSTKRRPSNPLQRIALSPRHGKVFQDAKLGSEKNHGKLTYPLWLELKHTLDDLTKYTSWDGLAIGPGAARYVKQMESFCRLFREVCVHIDVQLVDKSYRREFDPVVLQHFLNKFAPGWGHSGPLLMTEGDGFLPHTILMSLRSASGASWEPPYNGSRRYSATRETADVGRPKETHPFPVELQDEARSLAAKFRDLTKTKIPEIASDLAELAEKPFPASPAVWERFVTSSSSHIKVFDKSYANYEKKYLRRVASIVRGVLDPVKHIKDFTEKLRGEPAGVFRPLQESMLLQRLGILNRSAMFGGRDLVEFDPELLRKARRILDIDTYPVVQRLASLLVQRFDELCSQLSSREVKYTEFAPELAQNVDLRDRVLALELVWEPCSVVISQQSLDFVDWLGTVLTDLRDGEEVVFRRSLRSACLLGQRTWNTLLPSERAVAAVAEAGTTEPCPDTLFRVLPTLLYLRDLFSETSLFREMLCPMDLHQQDVEGEAQMNLLHALRSELRRPNWNIKIPENRMRWQKLTWFLAGGADEVRRKSSVTPADLAYFAQLQSRVASLSQFSAEAQKQWVCLLCVLASAKPEAIRDRVQKSQDTR
eukprot:CAMPEP_0204403002 /NCGR_PEP_ID=MMETSP0470-20130426/5611_1 /ASSEMBLY_ACC=CAM_ASM_000385 /TAXON_ID=2969 /ORGANISM="Oxyrrhis marina" /LENGTH=769 /DNA_ID=CAMNT_0051398107 /DNA_START=90 /DNA_END=2400 /DNA_ORIENTATION=-